MQLSFECLVVNASLLGVWVHLVVVTDWWNLVGLSKASDAFVLCD